MPNHGDRTGRDTLDAVLQRIDDLELKVHRLSGGHRVSFDRGDKAAFAADEGAFEGQTLIQYDTEKPWYFSNGEWRPFSSAGQWTYWYDLPLSDLGGGQWSKSNDATVETAMKYVHTGSNSAATDFIWAVALGPGTWDVHWTMKVGTGTGTVTYYLAGAYDYSSSVATFPSASPGSAPWVQIGSRDLSSVLDTYWDDHIGLTSFTISSTVPQYTLATNSTVNGSAGLYFLRVAFDGPNEVSKIVLVHQESVRYKSTSG